MKSFVNTKKVLHIFIASLFFFIGSVPVFAVDANPKLNLTSEYDYNPSNPSTGSDFQIVPICTNSYKGSSVRNEVGEEKGECDWVDLLKLVRNVMSLLLFLSAIIAVLSFMYAGFLYLTSFGDMGKVEKAHGIFSKVIIGFLFVFLGWLIVATILKTMGVTDDFNILDTRSVPDTNFTK